MDITIGQLVKVVSKETLYFEKFGEVVEISNGSKEDGSIGIRFDIDDLFYAVSSEENCVVRFKPQELSVVTDTPVQYLAKKLFRNLYHSTRELSFSFSPKNFCMYEGCQNKATKRAVTNIWGTVIEVDVCDEHHTMCHGKCGEIFPISKNYKLVEQQPREQS
jgi:hypothetical protein